VAATRAAQKTTFFDVIAPEPRPIELELDVPQAQLHSIHEDLIAVGRRDGAKQLAVDTAAPLALRQMSKHQLRAERDRVAALLRDAPPDRSRLLAHTTDQRQHAEQGVVEAAAREQTARDRVAELSQGAGRLRHRRELTQARDHHALTLTAAALARQQADRAADRQRQARRAQQQHLAYQERHAGLLAADRACARELAWRNRADLRALELERPGWFRELGQPPASIKGQRAWRQAAAQILQYRERYGITDPEHPLGPERRHGDLEQRRHHRATRRVIERLQDRQRSRHERAHPDQPRSRPSQADRTRSARVDQRERGGREREAG
jgi:hypothetical protein